MSRPPKVNHKYPVNKYEDWVATIHMSSYDRTGKPLPLWKKLTNGIIVYRVGNERAIAKEGVGLWSGVDPTKKDFKPLTLKRRRMLWNLEHDKPVDWREW